MINHTVSKHHPKRLKELLLIIVSGLLASSAVFGQTATINDPGLNETDLDGQSVTITLADETFFDLELDEVNFTLNNAPGGLTIESFGSITSTSAIVNFAFTPGDFDASIPDFSISIDHSELTVTSSGELTTNEIGIIADIESATLTPSAALTEANLNSQTVTINLVNETFINPGSLVIGNFTPNGAPPGLSFLAIVGTPTSTQVQLDLQFIPGDFDTDYPSFSVSISPSVLSQSSAALSTNTIAITSLVESATLTPSAPLTEANLNSQTVTIGLVNETFINPGSLATGNFTPNGAPPGLSFAAIVGTPTSTQVVLDLQFSGDFDTDYDFSVSISPSVLSQSSASLVTNTIPILATEENPVATLSAVPALSEYSLHGREVSITLQDENFINPAGLIPGDFTPANAPPGLSIQSIAGTPTATNVRLVLSFNGTDFDVVYPDFHILIDHMVLYQSTEDLATSSLSIAYGLEPVITAVSIPNQTMRILSVVTVTITVENDEGNNFSLVGGDIGGYTLTGLSRVNATTYTSSFTVDEGGNSYAASQNIPVNNLQLMNGTIPGNTFNGTIIQANDLLDAVRPVIQYIYTNMAGAQNIGSEIFLWIQAGETGLTFDPESYVNYVPVSSPSIVISESGLGRYRLRYLVSEGDTNVNQGELAVSMTAVDAAGNDSYPPRPIDPNTLSIDATRPDIIGASVISTDDDIIVGETIEILVEADQPGYRNHEDTWINNVHVGPYVTFTNLGDDRYLYAYTVQPNDGSVERGNLAINIVLQDALPFTNTNLPFTDLAANNVQIETDRPSATISGTTEICAGDSALITVLLGGSAPWVITFSDGSSTFQRTSTVTNYSFWVQPSVTTSYTVQDVIDGTGNNSPGAGIATITVHPLPVVQILNLDPTYDVKSPPVVLEYTPLGEGGNFTGPGITENPWTFSPAVADTATSPPHEIEYVFTDPQTGCTNSDLREVRVVSESGTIRFQKSYACFNDSTFLITAINVAGTIGEFSVSPDPPAGAFEDLGDNTAILRPIVYNLNEDENLTIEYVFPDTSGIDIPISKALIIEYLEDAEIYEPPSLDLCQNLEPIDLNGNYDAMMSGYTYTGPGVVAASGNYYFDPGLASLGSNKVVYRYVSPRQCRVSDSIEFTVYDAPDAGFLVEAPCIPLGGGTVQFNSRSDAGSSVRWYWNFGDPASGSNNLSTLENPTHDYNDTGTYTVSLTVSMGNCNEQAVKTIDINPKPLAEFIWSSDCKSEAPIILTGQEETFNSPDTIDTWTWKIEGEGMEIFTSDTSGPILSFAFPSDGTYSITYKVTTAAGCSDSVDNTLSLSPTYDLLAKDSYLEDFEFEDHGWEISGKSSQNSWTFAPVSPDKFPEDAASGDRAWYTDLPDARSQENSWVVSPCFNFKDFHRPMVTLDIKRSLRQDREGATLQYTLDHRKNGKTWHNVGGVEDGGLEWYYSESIVPSIGDQTGGKSVGWTGKSDDHWYQSAHGLDELVGQPEVRFRIAFGSMGDSETGDNDGFAFDNFSIRSRTRLSVLEYFTNANTSYCAQTDTLIMEIMNKVPADVIDIHYHAMGSLADKFYLENPVPANNRGSYYGVTGIPFAMLDGTTAYDFSPVSESPNLRDIRLKSLMDPDFNLTITVTQYTPVLEFSIEMQALKDLERRELILYAIVLQSRVGDPEYTGTNGVPVFRHVARKMLPGAEGTYLGNKSWSKGEPLGVDLRYESSFFPIIEDSIVIVAFIQVENTREILQAATNPQYTVSTFETLETPPQVLIYPNPAGDLVNVYFEELPGEEMRFNLYNLSGKMVISDFIAPWQQLFTCSLGDLEQGLYIVEIRTSDRRRVLYRDKLLHY